MPEVKKYRTYIDGFDELLGGGIPEGHIVMLSGTAGTMKSSLSYTILHNNAVMNGTRSLYVSLEQSRGSLLRQLGRMGFSGPDAGSSAKTEIIDLGLIRKKMEGSSRLWLDLFKMYIEKARNSAPYELLVIDSMEALELLAKFKDHRAELFSLFRWLRQLKLTVILIAEIPQLYSLAFKDIEDFDIFSRHKEGYLVDGIIHLKMEKKGEFEVERRLRVVKMRGTKHSPNFSVLLFENKRFQVIPLISG
jgi:circadian clock protein KaiC